MSLIESITSDDIFERWEKSIDAYYKNLESLAGAEVRYTSALATAIKKEKEEVGSTLAKDVAKGHTAVLMEYGKLCEAERKVKAGKEKLEYLKELNIAVRLKEKRESEIAG